MMLPTRGMLTATSRVYVCFRGTGEWEAVIDRAVFFATIVVIGFIVVGTGAVRLCEGRLTVLCCVELLQLYTFVVDMQHPPLPAAGVVLQPPHCLHR